MIQINLSQLVFLSIEKKFIGLIFLNLGSIRLVTVFQPTAGQQNERMDTQKKKSENEREKERGGRTHHREKIIIKFGNRPERASEAVDKGPLINSTECERESVKSSEGWRRDKAGLSSLNRFLSLFLSLNGCSEGDRMNGPPREMNETPALTSVRLVPIVP